MFWGGAEWRTSSLLRCSWLCSVLALLSWLCKSKTLDWDALSLAKTFCMLLSTCRPKRKKNAEVKFSSLCLHGQQYSSENLKKNKMYMYTIGVLWPSGLALWAVFLEMNFANNLIPAQIELHQKSDYCSPPKHKNWWPFVVQYETLKHF